MVLAIYLTEGGRQTIAIFLIILHTASLLSGAGLCAVGFFLRYNLQSKVSLVDGYDGNVLPIVLMVVGGLTAIVNLVGSKLAFDVAHPEKRKRLRCLLLTLLILLFVALVALVTAGSMCFAHRHHLSRSFHHGLIKAMGKYQEDHALKYDIDLLQMQNQCCGNNGYEDWFDIQWINNNFLDLSNSKVQSKMTSGQYLTDDVPFSCCQPTSPRPCIHHQVHDNDIHFNYDYQVDLTLHPIGCKEKLMSYFGSKFNMLGGASFGMFGIQMLALLLTRYLQTSIAEAIAEGDPEAPAPGSLCPGGEGPPPPKGDEGCTTKIQMSSPGKVGDMTSGKGGGNRGGSMEDFEDHDLDVEDEEGYDTLLDDSTFDDEFDEPVITKPTKSYNPYENDDQYGSEPIYENVNGYGSEMLYEEPIRHEEPLYENIPAYLPAAMDAMSPMAPSGLPPQMPKGAPPPRPTTGAPKRPTGPPSKQPPPRPSQPPSRPSGKKGPGKQPKTSTPKKSAQKQGSKRGASASPTKSTKSAKHAQTTKSKSRSPSKSPKRSPTRSAKKSSPKRSPKSSRPKTKSAPKRKKGKSAGGKKRGGAKKSKKKRSRNRNNNILEPSGSDTEFTTCSTSEDEDSSSDSSSLDLETGSILGESDISDISSDTPLLTR